MANIASQIKRNRQTVRRHDRNQAVRSQLKTFVKRFHTAAESGDRAAASEAFKVAVRTLDKAVSKGVVHRNFAARRKSRMASKLAAL